MTDLIAELAACPFCGCAAELLAGLAPFVECAECGATGAQTDSEDEAIAAWNTRTHHAEIAEAVKGAGKHWALHFLGPDDVVAAPSREAAEIVARNFNAFWEAQKQERGHDVHVVAEVIEWEHGTIEHAKSAALHWPEYADLLEPAAIDAQHNSAREGS